MTRTPRRALPALLVLAVVGAGLVAVPSAAQAQSVGSGPFDRQDVFCVRHPALPNRNSSSPGVTRDTITVSDVSVDTRGLRRLGIDQPDFNGFFKALVAEINERCGGINGRRLVLKSALGNPLAPDPAGHQQANCLKVTEDQKAFAVVGIGIALGTFPRCVSVLHKTIGIYGAGINAADFADSKGRLLASYPATDRVAGIFVADAVKQRRLQGRKVAVIGSNIRATAVGELRQQYIAPLKARGIDAQLEVLPCQAQNCKGQAGAAVSRMKNAGINTIIVSHLWSAGNVGALYKQLAEQKLRARLIAPFFGTIHQDSTLPQQVADAGREGAEWVNELDYRIMATTPNEIVGGWRVGVKETPFSRMCHNLLARRMGHTAYQYNERDINNARWGAAATACVDIRVLARALHSLGANVTTERSAAALAAVRSDRRDTTPVMRERYLFSGRDVAPGKVSDIRFHFPCPLAQNRNLACMLPVDRPIRIRSAQ